MIAPDRADASANDCDHLAAHPETSDRERVRVADDLLWCPLTHPMRCGDDRVPAMSEDIRHRRDTPDALRAFAEELRAGSDAMCAMGWMRTLYGGAK